MDLQIKSTSALHDYQEKDVRKILSDLKDNSSTSKLLYQLPTGGGKTRIFSELAKYLIEDQSKGVLILTHRIELCRQTSKTLKNLGIKNTIIDSHLKKIPHMLNNGCYVAMVETLYHRIEDKIFDTTQIGLVIVDEAHHNSFNKLLLHFENAKILGVTATPLSSDAEHPLKNFYNKLIVGEGVSSLITKQHLAKPKTYRYDVELNTLTEGTNGDFSTASSDELYSSPGMLELLYDAYMAHARGKKTLIFNNGIFTSNNVLQYFHEKGLNVKSLDNHTEASERKFILKWFKNTKDAILTSVSILTTGFDEPSVKAVMLNRATNSLTLLHQMIGRGSRCLPDKKSFTIVDLGNNIERLGKWEEPIDWTVIFDNPELYYHSISTKTEFDDHHILPSIHAKFPNTTHIAFDVQATFKDVKDKNLKTSLVLKKSIDQHVKMCLENSKCIPSALILVSELDKEIEWRVKQFTKCLGNVTKNYREYLLADYKTKLTDKIKSSSFANTNDLKVA
ncbi:DEAD/DEAH box helicase [Mucilaginibacter ginkgonis]|uniref:DEAD/DEAH box helicase n=1 Tax=Mucilaginibacter ginkgonis TaxID=2682091 RepID=A0A6I4HUE9_9SPHI|nr:DEAD/DEAH box helicase [Mucilaginibacter ginkgonis]QQL50223.1 DEAD/DEAH box helicase [Mucilaginibacter ginkgonis]